MIHFLPPPDRTGYAYPLTLFLFIASLNRHHIFYAIMFLSVSQILRLIRRFWPSMLVMCVILYATLTSDPLCGEPLPAIPHIDKAIHFLMMGGLASAIFFDIRRYKEITIDGTRRQSLSPSVIICVALGVTFFSIFDEWMQGQLAIGRPSDINDAIANLLGIITASILAPPVLRRIYR